MREITINNCAGYEKEADNQRNCAGYEKEADNQRNLGMWIPLEEYARVNYQKKRTLQHNIKIGVFPYPVRKSLKPNGQKGSGYEVWITNEKTIKAVSILRKHRTAGLLDTNGTEKRENTKTIKVRVPYEIYLAGDFLRNKMPFTDYLKLALPQGPQQLIHKHKQISFRVRKQDHEIISNTAKEAGIQITAAYGMLYEKYVTSLSDLLPKN